MSQRHDDFVPRERKTARRRRQPMRNRMNQLNDITNRICECSKDRDGSKFIQRKLDEATEHRRNAVFDEMFTELLPLMKHRFANFVVQKYFNIGNGDQRDRLYRHIKVNFLELSLDRYGCRVVQKAIETATIFQLSCLLEQFTEQNVIALVKDANGNHVVQNIFRSASNVENRHIQDVLVSRMGLHVMDLCHHLYGCRVIQCILQYGSAMHRDYIFDSIWTNPMDIIENRYGNYVIQSLTRNCSPSQQNRLVQFVLEHVIAFSKDKYASNVVEACICSATPLQQQQALDVICELEPKDLMYFCVDASANYVVQKLMDSASADQLNLLVLKLVTFFGQMERYVCGRIIVNKLKTILTNNLTMALYGLTI